MMVWHFVQGVVLSLGCILLAQEFDLTWRGQWGIFLVALVLIPPLEDSR